MVTSTDDPRPGQNQDGGEPSAVAPIMVSHRKLMLMRKMWLELEAQGKWSWEGAEQTGSHLEGRSSSQCGLGAEKAE